MHWVAYRLVVNFDGKRATAVSLYGTVRQESEERKANGITTLDF
jgi:hypothetical protein